MGLIAATTSLAAWLMRDVINQVFIERNEAAVWWLSAVIVGLYAVKGFATYGQQVTLSRIANAIVASVQRRLCAHLLRMDVRYFLDRLPPSSSPGRVSSLPRAAASSTRLSPRWARSVVAHRPAHRHGASGSTDVDGRSGFRDLCADRSRRPASGVIHTGFVRL